MTQKRVVNQRTARMSCAVAIEGNSRKRERERAGGEGGHRRGEGTPTRTAATRKTAGDPSARRCGWRPSFPHQVETRPDRAVSKCSWSFLLVQRDCLLAGYNPGSVHGSFIQVHQSRERLIVGAPGDGARILSNVCAFSIKCTHLST